MGEFEEQDWMELASEDLSKVRLIRVGKPDEFQDESEILDCPVVKTQPPLPSAELEQLNQPTLPRPKSTTNEPYIDPSRLSDQQVVYELFQGLAQENVPKPVHFPLKQSKDFVLFAKILHERMAQEPPDEKLEEFAEELLLHLYETLWAEDLNQLADKLKVLKLEKKREDKERFSKKKTLNRKQPKPPPQDDFM